jgi:hypothetical protein
VVEITGGFKQPLHFIDAENIWQRPLPFRHGKMFVHVPPLQRFHVRKTQRCNMLLDRAGSEVKISKQVNLVLKNLIRAELLGRPSEVSGESLDGFKMMPTVLWA